jgi:hypothetical protein
VLLIDVSRTAHHLGKETHTMMDTVRNTTLNAVIDTTTVPTPTVRATLSAHEPERPPAAESLSPMSIVTDGEHRPALTVGAVANTSLNVNRFDERLPGTSDVHCPSTASERRSIRSAASLTTDASRAEPVIERWEPWPTEAAEFDGSTQTLRNVVLSGGTSRNGHRYLPSALQAAVPLYDRKPVFLDHATNPLKPFDRSMRDLVGCIRNPRFVDGQIRGDIEILQTEAGQTFLALVQGDAPAMGMSHVVLAERAPGSTWIERIQDVISVDAVAFPATTRSLRESQQSSVPGSWESAVEQLDALLPGHLRACLHAPELLVRRLAVFSNTLLCEARQNPEDTPQVWEIPWHTVNQSVQLAPTPQRHTCLATAIEQTQCDHVRRIGGATMESALSSNESHSRRAAEALPDFAITDLFLQQLEHAGNAEQQNQLIQERARLIARAQQPRPASRPRQQVSSGWNDARIVSAIRGDRRPGAWAPSSSRSS